MDNFVWLEEPVHKNVFKKFKFYEDDAILEALKLSFDGTIMAVNRDKVESHYKDQEVKMMKLGFKPYPKKFDVSDEESFYRCLSHYIDLE